MSGPALPFVSFCPVLHGARRRGVVDSCRRRATVLVRMPDPQEVRAMFGRIAGRYDLLNRVLSMGVDRAWRRRTVRAAGRIEGRTVLDVACGTGDLALAFAAGGARVLGVDFTFEMLALAGCKAPRAKAGRRPRGVLGYVQGDGLRLPVADASVDVASVAFGLRNMADRRRGLAELARVVRPGGRVLVLEFSMPPGRLLGVGYRAYFTRVLPVVGGALSGDRSAYEYLPATVRAWPAPEELRDELASVGLFDCGFERLSGGIACLHSGTVPL